MVIKYHLIILSGCRDSAAARCRQSPSALCQCNIKSKKAQGEVSLRRSGVPQTAANGNPPAESMLSAGGLQIFRGLLRFLASPCRLPVQGFCRPHTSSRSSRRPAPRSASESALRASSLQDSGPSGTDRAANPHSRAPPRAWQWGSRPGSYLTAYSKFLLFLPCNLLP